MKMTNSMLFGLVMLLFFFIFGINWVINWEMDKHNSILSVLYAAEGKEVYKSDAEALMAQSKNAASKGKSKKVEKTPKNTKNSKDAEKETAISNDHNTKPLNADQALKRLRDGNARFMSNKALGPNRTSERRMALTKGQKPFAVVLSCSDSRVPPEIIFDQGMGDIFVIRSAGNLADKVGVGSIEYAVEHLGVRLIMVLGHKSCGAVDAATKGGAPHGEVKTIVEMIKPAVDRVKNKHGDLLENAVKSNVKMVADKLRTSKPILSEMMNDGVLKIVGGYYDLETGEVDIIYNPCMAGA